MPIPLPILAAGILVLIIITVLTKRRSRNTSAHQFRKCGPLLTPAERSFYENLKRVMPPTHTLFAKVRIADLITTTSFAARNSINQKHIDFLICDSATLTPALIIELDDSSHQREDRKQRDILVDKAFKSAQLSIIHIPTEYAYNPTQLADKIKVALAS